MLEAMPVEDMGGGYKYWRASWSLDPNEPHDEGCSIPLGCGENVRFFHSVTGLHIWLRLMRRFSWFWEAASDFGRCQLWHPLQEEYAMDRACMMCPACVSRNLQDFDYDEGKCQRCGGLSRNPECARRNSLREP